VDSRNHTIRKITPAGNVTTFAGFPGSPGTADGTGSCARFYSPFGITVDGSGNLYVADTSNSLIRKVTSAGVVTTIAGVPRVDGTADGFGPSAKFNGPWSLVEDGHGNLYVTDCFNFTVRKVTTAGQVTTIAGFPLATGSADGVGPAARFNYPEGIALDGLGGLYVSDCFSHTIRKVHFSGAVSTLLGSSGVLGGDDGTGSMARFNNPRAITVNGGLIYIVDTANQTIRVVQ
jgi:hypothetical protein